MPNTDLVRLLNRIGKSTFVRYYEEFSDSALTNQDVVGILPPEYTLKSRNSRTSKARRIFREGLEEDALTLILDSDHVDAETANRARELLNRLPASSDIASNSMAALEAMSARTQRRIEQLQTQLDKARSRPGDGA